MSSPRIPAFFTVVFLLTACGDASQKTEQNPLTAIVTTPVNEAGKQLFIARCSSCHKVNVEQTGPALNGVEKRWPSRAMLYAFIRNSAAVIDTNAYARQLFLTYNQTKMTAHPDLTDRQIDHILDYIKQVSVPKS